MSYRFKGTGTICGVQYLKKLRKVDEDNSGDEIETTGGGDTCKTYEAGDDDDNLNIEALGDAPARKATGTVDVDWGDGTYTDWPSAVITKRRKSGSHGQLIVYTFTVRKTDE